MYQDNADSFNIPVNLPKDKTLKCEILLEDKVRVIKEKLLRENDIPFPIKYLMVLITLHDEKIVLDDNSTFKAYADHLRFGQLQVKRKCSEIERPPRQIKPENFGIMLK